jgi:hypothetical protein
MYVCCALHTYIYKNVMLFQVLFPALSDDTEIRNICATIALHFPSLAMMLVNMMMHGHLYIKC